ncbi:MAG TPA: hypothetical protein VGI24_10635 [Solirubrobacteraceae bacterium]
MSDAPGQTGPDLHAIFGMDNAAGTVEDPIVEVERALATEDLASEPSPSSSEESAEHAV